jgi:hypothetical protein
VGGAMNIRSWFTRLKPDPQREQHRKEVIAHAQSTRKKIEREFYVQPTGNPIEDAMIPAASARRDRP